MIKPEQACQVSAIAWLRHYNKEAELSTYHFANERKCTIQQGRLLKRMGVKPGVSDLFISIPKHNKHGLWIEIKIDNNYPSKEQKDFLEREFKNGAACAVCWGLDAIKSIIIKYLSTSTNDSFFDQIIHQK